MEFEEHPKNNDENSPWFHFLREKQVHQHAKCKICGNILKASGGTTSGLHTHLKSKHEINLLKRKIVKSPNCNASSVSTESNTEIESLPLALARMAACDCLSFNVICTSIDIRKGLEARGFQNIPKCPKTTKKIVMEYSRKKREELTKQFLTKIENGERFCLTFDEWSSTRNRRYMNLNVHTDKEFWNLGLTRAKGTMPAEKCVELVNKKLNNHGLRMEEHIIAATTDGAKVMIKVGKLIESDQQLCFAHGIHLAVGDVLYGETQKTSIEDDGSDSESMDEENSAFEIEEESDNYEEAHDIFPLIAKIRKVVKAFRNSPVKNDDILQKYVKEEFGEEFALILDVKIRWNSLFSMVERFHKLRNCIQKALIDLKSTIKFSESEFDTMYNIISTLLPIKLAVEAICQQGASLLTADVAIKFMFEELSNNRSSLSNQMIEALKIRIAERRTDFSSLLQYLHNQYNEDHVEESNVKSKNKSQEQYFNEIFPKLSKTAITKKIVSLIERLENIKEDEAASNDVTPVPNNDQPSSSTLNEPESRLGNLTLKNKLQLAISKRVIETFEAPDKVPNSLIKIVKREILTFEELNVKGKYLKLAYNYLLAIRPSSVEAERAFSAAGLICTKIRSRLGDQAIDELCFLRSYFNKSKPKKAKRKYCKNLV